MSESVPASESRAGKREWIGLAVLAFPCFLLAVDFTVLHLAVPKITADLAPSSAQLLWIVDIYGFFIASSLITMGTLGDRIGRRRLLMFGGAAFGAASAVAAFAGTASTLIVTRALLGVAGATLMPSTMALIRNMFHDPDQRRVAIAVWINCFVVGGAIGPLLGGVMLEHFWWGSVFLLNVPVMIALLALAPILLPEFKDPDAGRLDILSAALSLLGILSVIYGIKRMAQDGVGTVALVSIVLGAVLGTVFVIRQRRLTHPLIDLELFKVPAFSAAVGTQLIATITFGGLYLLVSQYLQLVVGLSPLHAGMALLPATVAGTFGTIAAPLLVRRIAVGYVMPAGMILSAVGMALIAMMNASSGIGLLVAAYIVMSFGVNVAMTLTTDTIMGVAPPERAGAASGISETAAELGAALGIALLGSISTAYYRSAMGEGMPSMIPTGVAVDARATIGGAVVSAATLGGERGAELAQVAREAFTRSLSIVAVISAALVVITSAVTIRVLSSRGRLRPELRG
jgi:MFS transporter, DHA2 family, multidrug resistance protein